MSNNNNGLFPHDVAKRLYKMGRMPTWAYVQLYATPEEAAEIFEEQRKQNIDKVLRQRQEQQEKEEQKKAEEKFFKDAEKKINTEIDKALQDLFKPFSK